MAITTTITKSAGWARTDVIDQLEQGFTWLGLHGTRISGLVTSISSYSGGGTVGSSNTAYFDVPVATTSGIGTGATFDVYRSSGNVSTIYVNRPGNGYVDGEFLTLSPADVGGGAVAIGITVLVEGGASPVGYGSTNQFFDKNLTPPNDSTRPWAVLKQDFNTNKRFGVTYRAFKVHSNYQMAIYAGSSFFPFDRDNTNNRGGQFGDSFRGTAFLDILSNPNSPDNSLDYQYTNAAQVNPSEFTFATTNSPSSHNLNLSIYRSSIDPKFAVLSFNQPSVSGSLSDSTFSTFIIHNFDSSLWDLDQVFSSGITLIDKLPSASLSNGDTSSIGFKTYLVGNRYPSSSYSTRTAEAGWAQIYNIGSRSGAVVQNYNICSSLTNNTSSYATGTSGNDTLYNGRSAATIYSRIGGIKDTGILTSNDVSYGNRYPITTYNAVIKGIPINGNLIPCPYYIPDDFVVIDFRLATSGQDIKQGDTITISGSEVYTVITGSYNKFGETAGVLFCARTV